MALLLALKLRRRTLPTPLARADGAMQPVG